jgi:diadenosine tetraphosphate (Ap4A) HIT family hydrolase
VSETPVKAVPDQRVEFDVDAYVARVQTGPCFICGIVSENPESHEVLWRDTRHIAFLSRYPTLPGYLLVSPREHLTDVVGLPLPEYLALQETVYRIANAVRRILPTERVYLMSLGSEQGNAHLHWHVACLPPGVPYRKQQFHALMGENGILDVTDASHRDLADRLRAVIAASMPGRALLPDGDAGLLPSPVVNSPTAVPSRRRIANRNTRLSRTKDLPLPLTTTGIIEAGSGRE